MRGFRCQFFFQFNFLLLFLILLSFTLLTDLWRKFTVRKYCCSKMLYYRKKICRFQHLLSPFESLALLELTVLVQIGYKVYWSASIIFLVKPVFAFRAKGCSFLLYVYYHFRFQMFASNFVLFSSVCLFALTVKCFLYLADLSHLL